VQVGRFEENVSKIKRGGSTVKRLNQRPEANVKKQGIFCMLWKKPPNKDHLETHVDRQWKVPWRGNTEESHNSILGEIE